MVKLIKKSIDISSVIIVVIMILLSGSAIYVIDSMVLYDHECCCKNNAQQSHESLKCGKNCCALVETKDQPLVGNIPASNVTRENTTVLCSAFYITGSGQYLQLVFINNPLKDNPQKLFLVTSVFRI